MQDTVKKVEYCKMNKQTIRHTGTNVGVV